MICPSAKAEYFCAKGWTGKMADAELICPSGNFRTSFRLLR